MTSFYYSSTRNFQFPVTIFTFGYLFLCIFSFCENFMDTFYVYFISIKPIYLVHGFSRYSNILIPKDGEREFIMCGEARSGVYTWAEPLVSGPWCKAPPPKMKGSWSSFLDDQWKHQICFILCILHPK